MKKNLGTIIGGSLCDGLLMRICQDVQLESIKTGKFVSIIGSDYRFFCLITDISLAVTHPDIVLFPPLEHETFLHSILKKNSIYATAQIKPMVMINKQNDISSVKTIPSHFSTVFDATKNDVSLIFGDESDPSNKYFNIGTPIDMDTPVCIDLEKLTERSTGIFGKTGTGKTFLTRLVLAGLVKNNKSVNLIFDMHSEYGLQARKEGTGYSFVKGLKTLFPNKVAIFSLDPESTRRRGGCADVDVTISYQEVSVEDIISLQEELNLHSTALEAAYLIYAKYKQNWLQAILSQTDIKEFANSLGAHPESIAALYRKLKRIEKLPFFKPSENTFIKGSSIIDKMMEYIKKDISIVVEFGNFTSSFCYLLVSNIITRRIHKEYIHQTEIFLGSQKIQDEPTKLLICIEEAHKFLNPSAAKQTIFGTIAREMRKYYVSLLVVDQRPSGIDLEIISQLGTKIVAQLNDEKDIQSVLNGMNNLSTLKIVLASLDSKKQALVMGYAVTMPIVVRTREYNDEFYKKMSNVSNEKFNEIIDQLF